MPNIIQKRKIWFFISAVVIIPGIISLFLWGLKVGIDFTGGTLLEIQFEDKRPELQEITKVIEPLKLENAPLQPTGEQGILLRTRPLDEEKHKELLSNLKDKFGQINEVRFETVGPTVGKELRKKAIWTVSLASICIVLYIAYAFRTVPKEVASWKFSLCAIFTLLHDILCVVGIFSILGHYLGIEITALFIVALLTILGYSVNDTIVVFDRIRLNLLTAKEETLEETINKSINQTLVRSINTASGTLFTLLAIFLFVSEPSVKYFVLALTLGILIGTYSSIFVASPLLMIFQKFQRKR